MQGTRKVVSFGMNGPAVKQKRATPMGKKLVARVDASQWRGSANAVLKYLCLKADETTRVVRGVGLDELARENGNLSYQRIKAIMQNLRNGGAVETIKRGGGKHKNVYRITLPPRSAGVA